MRAQRFDIILVMEKIATDISTSENLRRGGYTYVDKTDLDEPVFAKLKEIKK